MAPNYGKGTEATQGEPSVVLPDVVQCPKVTLWLFLIQIPGPCTNPNLLL